MDYSVISNEIVGTEWLDWPTYLATEPYQSHLASKVAPAWWAHPDWNSGALLSPHHIETIQNRSVIIHDSRSTFQGIRAKTISIYLKSEALYVNQEYENVSLSNEMAIIKTILDNRAVDHVTTMIPEAPDMAAVPIIKSLYAGSFDDDELEFWDHAS